MRLPAPLSRRTKNTHKNIFGHVLIIAGSQRMLGAGALSSLAAMRSGAGLVTLGIPKSLNIAAQKKISNTIMTLPLAETKTQSIALAAFKQIQPLLPKYQTLALGPGLSNNTQTKKFILKLIETSSIPLVIDADALNALQNECPRLLKTNTDKILTPHIGEMARLTGKSKRYIEENRKQSAADFAKNYNCVLLLKGHHTIVADPNGRVYQNTTGNPGMSTAGTGDVLTGMIAAFRAQNLSAFDAAKWGAYLHGKAGDIAAKKQTKLSMIATDIIDAIPNALKN